MKPACPPAGEAGPEQINDLPVGRPFDQQVQVGIFICR